MRKVVQNLVFRLNQKIYEVYLAPGRTLDVFWELARCYFYTLAFWSLFTAKILHLYAHLYSLPVGEFLIWGITFFFQDVVILLLLRIIAQKSRTRLLASLGALILSLFSLIVSGMAAANFSVYVFTGAEIHWRQAKSFWGGAAAVRTLLTGLTGFLIAEGILCCVTLLSGRYVHSVTGGLLHVLAWPFQLILLRLRCCMEPLEQRFQRRRKVKGLPDPELYDRVAMEDDYLEDDDDDDESDLFDPFSTKQPRLTERFIPRVVILGTFYLFIFLRFFRPSTSVYLFLSGTLLLGTVLEGGGHRMTPVDTTGIPTEYSYLDGVSSLHPPPDWDWMPKRPGPGFTDWDGSDSFTLHYSPSKSPFHISNLEEPVLEPVKNALKDLQIKHMVLLKLESAHADIFPLRKDSFSFERIAETYEDKRIPDHVQERIANLTSTARLLTGFPTGFENNTARDGRKAYGGLSASNAYTTSTYTLKSLAGTLCGVTPLVADLNREWEHHIYQPCLPHVLDMFSQQSGITRNTSDFTKWPWHSVWMQSVTETYDNQDKLTAVMGFKDKKTKEIIESPRAKHYPVETEEVNYYGYADTELREYMRDAIDDAERNHQRLFLTHLTGTTHHPWGIPNNTYQQILGSSKGHDDDLNRYLNAVGFVDDWLGTILDILEEKGVANETLLVMAGDHGLSLPNDGGITPYDNPHVGNFHIPIVLAHPNLLPFEIKAPVTSSQILPSILDLLIESSSLPKRSTPIAKDILSLYEGQSLIRPQIQEQDSRPVWHLTVMNTGGTWLGVRSAAKPEYRLVIPLVNDVEWRFTDLKNDPQENDPILRFTLPDLAHVVGEMYGEDVLHWLYDAAYVANWWVGENWKRYRYQTGEKGRDK